MELDNKQEMLIREISPERIRKHLQATGWLKIDFGSKNMELFSFAETEQIALPISNSLIDYSRRIKELINTLSNVEKRNGIEIFNELLTPISDRIRVRIESEETKHGNLPLKYGIDLIPSLRNILYASAMSLKKPSSFFYERMKNKEVDTYVDSCMLGQTERGSFVANIICPVDAQRDINGKPISDFGRATTINLINSIDTITKTIDDDPKHGTIETSIKENRINYNFCRALLQLKPYGENSKVVVNVSWAPEKKLQQPIKSEVVVRREHYEKLPNIVERLTPKDKHPMHEEFIGKVGALVGEEDKKQRRMYGEVILNLIGKTEIMRVKVFLDGNDYSLACDAHKNNKKISIEGRLLWGVMGTRVRTLQNYKNFRVID